MICAQIVAKLVRKQQSLLVSTVSKRSVASVVDTKTIGFAEVVHPGESDNAVGTRDAVSVISIVKEQVNSSNFLVCRIIRNNEVHGKWKDAPPEILKSPVFISEGRQDIRGIRFLHGVIPRIAVGIRSHLSLKR